MMDAEGEEDGDGAFLSGSRSKGWDVESLSASGIGDLRCALSRSTVAVIWSEISEFGEGGFGVVVGI